MTREEEIQAKAEELYGKVNKLFPISEFANEAKRNCFVTGAKWADKMMIDKACEWIETHIPDYYGYGKIFPEIIVDFRKAMEE